MVVAVVVMLCVCNGGGGGDDNDGVCVFVFAGAYAHLVGRSAVKKFARRLHLHAQVHNSISIHMHGYTAQHHYCARKLSPIRFLRLQVGYGSPRIR